MQPIGHTLVCINIANKLNEPRSQWPRVDAQHALLAEIKVAGWRCGGVLLARIKKLGERRPSS
eukprot:6182421-Pleurochrysis_carterae.AAC.1